MQERDNCRSQCKAGGLVLDRSRDGSLLVRGERPMVTNAPGLVDLLVVPVVRPVGGDGSSLLIAFTIVVKLEI